MMSFIFAPTDLLAFKQKIGSVLWPRPQWFWLHKKIKLLAWFRITFSTWSVIRHEYLRTGTRCQVGNGVANYPEPAHLIMCTLVHKCPKIGRWFWRTQN